MKIFRMTVVAWMVWLVSHYMFLVGYLHDYHDGSFHDVLSSSVFDWDVFLFDIIIYLFYSLIYVVYGACSNYSPKEFGIGVVSGLIFVLCFDWMIMNEAYNNSNPFSGILYVFIPAFGPIFSCVIVYVFRKCGEADI